MLEAIAAKKAEVARSQGQPQGQLRKAQPSKAAKARSTDAKPNTNPNATTRPDFRRENSTADGENPRVFV